MAKHDPSDWLDPAKDLKKADKDTTSAAPESDVPNVHADPPPKKDLPKREPRNRGWRLGGNH